MQTGDIMKAMLINPPYDAKKYYGKLSSLRFLFPPVGLLHVASYVRARGGRISLFDFETSEKEFKQELIAFKPDIIGITCQTALVNNTITLCKEIKDIYRDVPIVVGGNHPSIRPMDLLETGLVDYIVRGEGEITFYELAKAIYNGGSIAEIKGISYLDAKTKLINLPNRELIEDLDTLPMMAIDLLPIEKFHTSPDLLLGKRTALILTSRGCPNKCIFCALKEGFRHNRYRTRSIRNIFDEIDYYRERYDIDSLFIMDDTFTLNRQKVDAFCDMMISLGYSKDIKWWAQTRVDTVNEELLLKMKKAGCEILSYGLESGVQKLLNIIRKRTTVEGMREVIRISKRADLNVRGSFILGLPEESIMDSLRTIYFGLSLPLDRVKFGLATPYPGTELWDIAEREGQINEPEDWDRFTQMAGFTKSRPAYIPKNRHALELKVLQVMANTLFYLKPRIFAKMINQYAHYNLMGKFLKSTLRYLWATFSR